MHSMHMVGTTRKRKELFCETSSRFKCFSTLLRGRYGIVGRRFRALALLSSVDGADAKKRDENALTHSAWRWKLNWIWSHILPTYVVDVATYWILVERNFRGRTFCLDLTGNFTLSETGSQKTKRVILPDKGQTVSFLRSHFLHTVPKGALHLFFWSYCVTWRDNTQQAKEDPCKSSKWHLICVVVIIVVAVVAFIDFTPSSFHI